jgi:tetratricopeptide (TPR) repeat protein
LALCSLISLSAVARAAPTVVAIAQSTHPLPQVVLRAAQEAPASAAARPGPSSDSAANKITLDVSETFFSFFAGLNSCGYDQELSISDPVRNQVRADVIRAVAASTDAQFEHKQLCDFIRDHQAPDPARNISQYVSLAFYTSEPPAFKTTLRESDLPPDSQAVLGYLPVLQAFYDAAHLHLLWTKYQPQYEAYVDRFHDQVANMILTTDSYLRLPISGYVSRSFSLYIDPLVAPSEVNARNYGANYMMLMAPDHGGLKIDPVRHTYLHYILDPLALKRFNRMIPLKPLLQTVANAPLDDKFKTDIALLVTESLIHAVEIRTTPVPGVANEDRKERDKRIDAVRSRKVDDAMQQGFVLTHYFYDQFANFEKGEVGFQDAFGPMLTDLNLTLGREEKRARDVTFVKQGSPDLVRSTIRPPSDSLDAAEETLIAGDAKGAQEIAQEAMKSGSDQARATFIVARASSLQGHMQDAVDNFQKTLQLGNDPRMLAWSHIYLARIFDIQEDRESALKHYNAALNVGDSAPDTKAAAERGLQKPYEPPRSK